MKQEIKDELNSIGSSLAGSGVGMPYVVPDGYFGGLGRVLESVIAHNDSGLNIDLPVASLPYTVPSGYFEQLPRVVLQKTTAKERKGLLITFGQLRWAAAAVLLLAIGVSLFNLQTQGNAGVSKENILASVPDNDIKEYLAYTDYQAIPNPAENDYLNNAEIENKDIIAYLDQTGWEVN